MQAAKSDDLGAQAVAKELGGLPVVADASVPPGSVRVVLANDYTGPGSGLYGSARHARTAPTPPVRWPPTPRRSAAPSPILTAGSDKPECVN